MTVSSDSKPNILVIDDDEPTRLFLSAIINHSLIAKSVSFQDARAALKHMVSPLTEELHAPVDAILCDIRMPSMTGHEFLLELRSAGKEIPVVFLTGYLDTDVALQALRLGAFDVLNKPPDKQTLVRTLEIALSVGCRRRQMRQRIAHVKQRLSSQTMSDELASEVIRALDEIEKDDRTMALLALRNHSNKAS